MLKRAFQGLRRMLRLKGSSEAEEGLNGHKAIMEFLTHGPSYFVEHVDIMPEDSWCYQYTIRCVVFGEPHEFIRTYDGSLEADELLQDMKIQRYDAIKAYKQMLQELTNNHLH
jgi:hypothetical protein